MMYFADTLTTLNLIEVILAGLIALGALVGGFGYMNQSFKGGRDQKETEEGQRQKRLDKTLQDLVEAQEKRYLTLEGDHKDNLRLLGKLQGKVEEMGKQQKWFEGIFIEALEGYFMKNPGLATELSSKILKGRK